MSRFFFLNGKKGEKKKGYLACDGSECEQRERMSSGAGTTMMFQRRKIREKMSPKKKKVSQNLVATQEEDDGQGERERERDARYLRSLVNSNSSRPKISKATIKSEQ
ncbi:hypothetical protein B9Z55_022839 [Caenorhabditis nigoni]|uniref:Uncharacterized protein n=1 Tax=Caenorhabditis nigoni TaxID=1611254 RepID=A0A2G5SM78_9PELO|nr:hypothetical protein B9Z55_022839 [Caenorhabditis nigoni]